MFRFLFRVLNGLFAIVIGVLLIDEYVRRQQMEELNLSDGERRFLNDLILDQGEGVSLYYNEDASGMMAFPPPGQVWNIFRSDG